MATLALPLLALTLGCGTGGDPLARVDSRYTDVMVDLGVADRDTSRNVHNKEARKRKIQAERARVAFFHDKKVQEAIEEARASTDPVVRVKGEGYRRHMLVARSWTEEEKAEETRILGRLEEAASVEATWTGPDKKTEVHLDEGWTDGSAPADALDEAARNDLAQHFAEHRMRVVDADLTALIQLRNEVARREGFDDYWDLALAGQGLSPGETEAIIAELTPVVAPVNEAIRARIGEAAARASAGAPVADTFANRPMLRRRAGLEAGKDEADTFFDALRAEERVVTAFQDMGIPTDGWQVYSGPGRHVRSGVYGFPIRPPEHVAIVMSQDRRWALWQYEALFHEGGHAAWWKMIPESAETSPVLWDPPSPWFEGFAQFFERMAYDPAFTARYVPDLPEKERTALREWRARHAAEWITDSIVETLVERRLYDDPSDLKAITRFAAETRAKLAGDPVPPVTESGLTYDPALLSSLLWNYPAYSQNYLFAYLTEAWLAEAVRANVGDPVANAGVGPFLRDKVVGADATIPFPDRVAALLPGQERTAALKAYLEMPGPLPSEPAAEVPAATAAAGP